MGEATADRGDDRRADRPPSVGARENGDSGKRPVGADDKEVRFTATLRAGTRLQMQTWFYDAAGQELCGAYFAYVRRK